MRSSQDKVGKASPGKAAGSAPAPRYELLKHFFATVWPLGVSTLMFLLPDKFKIVIVTIFVLSFVLSFALAALKMRGRAPEGARRDAEEKPPRGLLIVAAFFLPAATRHAALGDMEEKYGLDVKDVGARAAKWLMVRDILVSSLSKMAGLPRALLVMALKAVGIYELYKRFIGK